MATDIAFSLGLLTIVKSRVPIAVKVFLAGLAIVDDLGAVLVIALFYTSQISFISLGFAALGLIVLLVANRMGVRSITFYGIVGIGVIWFAFLMSGVHATLAGVVAAFTIPASVKVDERIFVDKLRGLGKEMEVSSSFKGTPLITHHQLMILERVKKLGNDADTPLQRLEHKLNPFVSYFVMPVFALANAGVELPSDILAILFHPVSLGCLLGLLVGKFVGIVGSCRLLVRAGLASLPRGTAWSHMYGAALMAGIGFTMSLFITNLAYTPDYLGDSRVTNMIDNERVYAFSHDAEKELSSQVKSGELYSFPSPIRSDIPDGLIPKKILQGGGIYAYADTSNKEPPQALIEKGEIYPLPDMAKQNILKELIDKVGKGEKYEKYAKVGVLTGSLISMTLGLLLLRFWTPLPDPEEEVEEH